MLDDVVEYSTEGSAPGEYHIGTLPSKEGGKHVVVLARIAMGENLAASNTSVLLERLPHVQNVLVVGIAGAAPDPTKPESDVRLGDIVVSDLSGVIQYDHDKELVRDGEVIKEPRHLPRPPAARVAVASGDLVLAELENRRPWEDHFPRAAHLEWTLRPDKPDVLHDAEHPERVVERQLDEKRRLGFPRIFQSPIASANKLLKNARLRERLRKTFGVKAVEMEASGVADATWLRHAGYFVIRGTCDYCDDFKNDEWQGYAAMVAAAYARALLLNMRSESSPPEDLKERIKLPPADLSFLPQRLRDAFDAATKEYPRLTHALAELVRAESAIDIWEATWPTDRPWVTQVLQALDGVFERANPRLDAGELLVSVALPVFVACIRKQRIRTQLDRELDPEIFRRTLTELVASTPMVAQLLDGGLQEAGMLIFRWAMLRLLSQHRRAWLDNVLRAESPDVPLARWLAADSTIAPLVRSIGGEMAQFALLPEKHVFRFEEHHFSVRCKLVACILSLAELRVLGIDLLSTDVVQHIANLPDLVPAVEAQFRDLTITTETDGSWMLRGTCDEPVLDHAMNEMAAALDAELRSHRAAMSNYFAQHGGASFPTVGSRPEARIRDGVARYTTPHVVFALSADHARRLFMGSDLWGDASLAYRELYQNALDACRYREARSKYLDLPYTPRIRIFHGVDADGREFVECEDNGIGMDRDLIATCFAMAGRRFVNTDEFRREEAAWRERNIKIDVNSQFGIGVFSYFMVADELEVETTRMSPDGDVSPGRLRLRIPTASSFFRIVTLSPEEARAAARARCRERGDSESAFLDAGTRVRLTLRKTDSESEIVVSNPPSLDAIKQHVWFAEVDTEVRHHRGEKYVLTANQLAPWIQSAVEAGQDEPRFWWITDVVRSGEPGGHEVTTFRSRKSQNGGGAKYDCPGRVLVDGIATDVTTPGFIVNLRGRNTPKLSLDRREIRSDIRSLLERRAHAALVQLPFNVSDAFLSDLWTWDPRALHRANVRVANEGKAWIRQPYWWRRTRERPGPTVSDAYFPSAGRDTFGTPDYRNELLQLIELAKQMPDARDLTASVLEVRDVSSDLRKNLAFIPKGVWNAWTAAELAVPQAAALVCIERDRLSPMSPAYMSWLTGERISWCAARLMTFAELMDLAYEPAAELNDVIIDDRAAWLLGHGDFSMPWVEGRIETFDLLFFCANARSGLDEALGWYDELSKTLGIPNVIDISLARELGAMTPHEAQIGSLLRRGYGSGFRPSSVTEPRAALLARVVGVDCPNEPEKKPSFDGTEHEKGVHRELLRSLDRSTGRYAAAIREAGLDALCETARALGVSPASIAGDVRAVAARAEIICNWSEADLAEVAKLDTVDWNLLEVSSDWVSRKAVRALTLRKLGAAIGSNAFWLKREYGDSAGVHRRLTELYALFRWGSVPIDVKTVAACLELEYSTVALLHRVPANLRFSIPRLALLAREIGASFFQLADQIRLLAPLGVVGPRDGDSYMGQGWQSLTADAGPERQPGEDPV
jgi:nucleoside phosphorylase